MKQGYVYFLKCNQYVKIGRTKNMKSRMKVYRVESPFNAKLIHSIKTNDCFYLEKYFHKIFNSKRVKGEWFELTNQDINDILSNLHYIPDEELESTIAYLFKSSDDIDKRIKQLNSEADRLEQVHQSHINDVQLAINDMVVAIGELSRVQKNKGFLTKAKEFLGWQKD